MMSKVYMTDVFKVWKFEMYIKDRRPITSVHLAKNSQGAWCVFKTINVGRCMSMFVEVLVLRVMQNTPGIVRMEEWAYNVAHDVVIIQFPRMVMDLQQFMYKWRHHARVRRKYMLANVAGLLETLVEVHRHGIVHRDLKPANILLDDKEYWFLHDFGNSIWEHKPGQEYATDMANTVTHRPPECMGKDRMVAYDQKIDVWALGIICYELWFGSLPIESYEYNVIRDFYLLNPVETWATLWSLPEPWMNFFYKCLQSNPQHRFSAYQLMALPLFKEVLPGNAKNSRSPIAIPLHT